MPLRTAARMTALSPGQSPPPVRMPTLMLDLSPQASKRLMKNPTPGTILHFCFAIEMQRCDCILNALSGTHGSLDYFLFLGKLPDLSTQQYLGASPGVFVSRALRWREIC